jgi:CheY-like chemotaxis protein/predicted transcriptional regulator
VDNSKLFSLAVIERILRILNDSNEGVKRTNLAGRAGLNYGACVRYVELLQLLRWATLSSENDRHVRLTQPGKEFLIQFEENRNQKSRSAGSNVEGSIPEASFSQAEGHSVLERHMHPDHRSYGENARRQAGSKSMGNILVIEDEQDVLLTYELFLRDQGFNVYAFSDPRLALQVFKEKNGKHIDLVMSDIRMNSINGIQLYREMKSINPGVRIVLVSALDAGPELASALPGFERKDLLTKPVSQSMLLKVAVEAVDDAQRLQGN